MEIINKPITELVPYAKNPRKNDEAVKYVAESIKMFGFKVPCIVDKNNVIVAGHTRYRAAKLLGMEEIPCIIADDLTDEQIQAFRLADNKVAEIAEWDEELLTIELADIVNIDMEDFGFVLDDEEEEKEEPPEVEFTETLEEDHNYVVLYFNNKIDWLQAETLFDIKTVKNLSTKKNGKQGIVQKGVGRVIDGAEALKKAGLIE